MDNPHCPKLHNYCRNAVNFSTGKHFGAGFNKFAFPPVSHILRFRKRAFIHHPPHRAVL